MVVSKKTDLLNKPMPGGLEPKLEHVWKDKAWVKVYENVDKSVISFCKNWPKSSQMQFKTVKKTDKKRPRLVIYS